MLRSRKSPRLLMLLITVLLAILLAIPGLASASSHSAYQAINLVSDLTYMWIDPRIDFEAREV